MEFLLMNVRNLYSMGGFTTSGRVASLIVQLGLLVPNYLSRLWLPQDPPEA